MSHRGIPHESARPQIRPPPNLATLEEIDIRSELRSRPHRPPNYEAEDLALAVLATEMTENPRNMLQRLVEMALELCQAGSAGISILEGEVFRWESLAGVLSSRRNDTMPRRASPSGVCIDRNSTQLMYLADRRFPALLSEPRLVEALVVPFQHHGKPVGTVWIVAHNYERKFDSEDERVVRTLAHFAASGWQLWKAYKAEAESSRNKDEFVAMLGHELRNPLAAIVNANELLYIKLGAKHPEAMHAVDVVARQSQHLSRMVDDLIDLSRIEHGKLTLHKEQVELRAVIDHAVETTRTQIERRKHRLSIECPPEPIILEADPVRIAQLLSNLLDNAAKYTPTSGEISIAAKLEHDRISIGIRDTGIGIPKDQIDNIFELFTQLHGPQMTSSRGLGMGLALVRTLADLHGGTVGVVSAGAGQGSLFTVRLPIAAKPSIEDRPHATAESSEPAVGRRILLVEDNADVAEGLGSLLAMDGHKVSIAQDGIVALAMLLTFKPEVVLLDIGLPGIDGNEVARRIRAETTLKNLFIVALSGFGEAQHRRRSIEAGCDDYLVKPIQPDFIRSYMGRVGLASKRS